MRVRVGDYRIYLSRRLLVVFMAAVSVLIMFSAAFVSRAQVRDDLGYRSILIEKGDSINRIAATHMSEADLSFDDMVYEIRRLNRVSTDLIYADSYLVIPSRIGD